MTLTMELGKSSYDIIVERGALGRVGELLNHLLSLVLAGELPNEREKLLDYVRKNTQEEL